MVDQLDLFAGTEDAPVKKKPKPKRVSHVGEKKLSGFTQSEEDMVIDFAKRWVNSGARELLDADWIKFKNGESVLPMVVAEYQALIKAVMRDNHINAKHYLIFGYGTTKMGIVTHENTPHMKFVHRETDEAIYVKL